MSKGTADVKAILEQAMATKEFVEQVQAAVRESEIVKAKDAELAQVEALRRERDGLMAELNRQADAARAYWGERDAALAQVEALTARVQEVERDREHYRFHAQRADEWHRRATAAEARVQEVERERDDLGNAYRVARVFCEEGRAEGDGGCGCCTRCNKEARDRAESAEARAEAAEKSADLLQKAHAGSLAAGVEVGQKWQSALARVQEVERERDAALRDAERERATSRVAARTCIENESRATAAEAALRQIGADVTAFPAMKARAEAAEARVEESERLLAEERAEATETLTRTRNLLIAQVSAAEARVEKAEERLAALHRGLAFVAGGGQPCTPDTLLRLADGDLRHGPVKNAALAVTEARVERLRGAGRDLLAALDHWQLTANVDEAKARLRAALAATEGEGRSDG